MKTFKMDILFREIEINGNKYKIYKSGLIESKRKVLKPQPNGTGYFYVCLGKGFKKDYKNYYIHRIVAKLRLENPENLPEINHKDGNKSNNCADNLEWCTRQFNIDDYKNKGRAKYPERKKVAQYDLQNNLLKIWDGTEFPASFYNCTSSLIQQAATPTNKVKTAKGFKWLYIS